MRPFFEPSGDLLSLLFEGGVELDRFVAEAERDDGFLVNLPVELKLYQEVTLDLLSGGRSWRSVARVIQVFPRPDGSFATAFRVSSGASLPGPQAEAKTESEPEPESEPAAGEDLGETLGVSPSFRIRKMNVSERIRLAMKASYGERQILVRDSSPQVLMALLANPRLEEREVLELAKSPGSSAGVLERIGNDPRWTGSQELRLALVKNPQTPTVLAQRLLPTLPKRDLGMLAKSSQLREAVKGAALRLYLKKL